MTVKREEIDLDSVLITTGDGSHTFFVPKLNEHYHSTNGAIQESMHVYIRNGLLHVLQNSDIQEINILEIGFGTGLNAFLTLQEAEKHSVKIFYHTLELYPIPLDKIDQLNYADQTGRIENYTYLFYRLHTAAWENDVSITSNFTLHKEKIDFSKPDNLKTHKLYNLIYFDAFAPEKQPEMWTKEIFDHLFSLCNKNATLTTYCAKGSVRRMLQESGFTTERLPGPPGKREILRASNP